MFKSEIIIFLNGTVAFDEYDKKLQKKFMGFQLNMWLFIKIEIFST